MFGLFEPAHRRVKDEREVGHYFNKYGEDALAVLQQRASDKELSARDRRHWRRLARKARRQESEWLDSLKSS
ncbi:MAG: hypothetical protein GW808_10385 [Sphingomonadales bacterium]|nr:hypothetical protein [Sphingomonadales bacterium]PIX64274.1 MAG: hypothetical protein COZ43_12085 [Sphingomonadales bacterium CG_4_10_14_3_um_filter_58_15]NCO50028.1 hypothetical protein [Sphingomonadales bacterium]NCO99947.1 hypothetical protein [Sphingomonadales bacterium]NCP25927.1 hypothetical protein [Sphingomonadales bacterium]